MHVLDMRGFDRHGGRVGDDALLDRSVQRGFEFEEIAAAISNGILETLRNEGQLPDSISSASYPPESSNNSQNERPPSPLSDNTPASKLYRVQVGAFKNRNYAYEFKFSAH